MRRQHLLALMIVVGAGLGASSCTVEDTSLLIKKVVPPPTVEGGVCTIEVGGEQFLSRGTLDALTADSYHLIIEIENQLKASNSVGGGGLSEVNLEGNTVQLTGATVTVEGQIAAFVPAETFIPLSAVIEPGDLAVMPIRVFSALQLQSMRTNLAAAGVNATTVSDYILTVKLEGTTTSGTDVESPEFVFPGEVCFGCLLGGVSLADGEVVCTDSAAAYQSAEAQCFPGQDRGMSCVECHATYNSVERCGRKDEQAATTE